MRDWRDQPSPCIACGARFRSAIAEAKHRHNFPVMCKRNRAFARWQREITTQRLMAATMLDKLSRGEQIDRSQGGTDEG